MENKVKSKKYDLPSEQQQSEDELLSTKLSDLEASDLYKSYKFSFEETKISREEIEEKEQKVMMRMKE